MTDEVPIAATIYRRTLDWLNRKSEILPTSELGELMNLYQDGDIDKLAPNDRDAQLRARSAFDAAQRRA